MVIYSEIPMKREVIGVGHGTIYTDGRKAVFEEDNILDKTARGLGELTIAGAIGAAAFLLVRNALN